MHGGNVAWYAPVYPTVLLSAKTPREYALVGSSPSYHTGLTPKTGSVCFGLLRCQLRVQQLAVCDWGHQGMRVWAFWIW